MKIDDIIMIKIDMFMKKNIVNLMDPNKVFWWISVSGGKDSYAMALAIFLWYKKNNYIYNGEAIFINQWDKREIYHYLCKKIDWMPVRIIEAVNDTSMYTNYKIGMQAPCMKCSQVRKQTGDIYIMHHYKNGYYNVLARGLHLTDMAISYLWRNFWGIDTIDFAENLEKGKPFEKLNLQKEIYLAKPLCLIREYECEQFSNLHQYKAICCGCPACAFPSRRDIVEESIRQLWDDGLWEFSVKGIKTYLDQIDIGSNNIREVSLRGKENKCSHLSGDFIEYALKYWKSCIKYTNIVFDTSNYLDDIGYNFLVNNVECSSEKIYMPKFFGDVELSIKEKLMIATVGPFWGAVGYSDKKKRDNILQLQYDICNIKIDSLWSQVNSILKCYYNVKKMEDTIDEKKAVNQKNYFNLICDCHCSSNSKCESSDL